MAPTLLYIQHNRLLLAMPTDQQIDVISSARLPGKRDWRKRLPTMGTPTVTLRELKLSDGPSLLANLATVDVQRYIAPAPTTLPDFEVFIQWTRRARKAGRFMCYGIVPRGHQHAVGLLELWPLDPSFATVEAGVALGRGFWGTGLFLESSRLFLNFVFDVLKVERVEGRSAVPNLRGNAALRKLGLVEEGVLQKCFLLHDERVDHIIWSMLAENWRRGHATAPVH